MPNALRHDSASPIDDDTGDPWMPDFVAEPEERHSPLPVAEAEPTRKRRRNAITALALGIVIVLAATWFSNAQSVEDIASQGTIGVRAEATLSAAGVARNGVAQAALIMRANGLDVATDQELDSAVAAARSTVVELEQRVAQLDVDFGQPATVSAAEFVASLEVALAAIARSDEGIVDGLLDEVDVVFLEVESDLASIRTSALNEMVVARDTAGQVAVGARLVVAFLMPLGAVLLYRFTAVRAARRRELVRELDQE